MTVASSVGRPRRHPLFARLYSLLAPSADSAGGAAHRRSLLAGTTGHVIEVGCGSGLNFSHYPKEVTDVVAVEPEPYLRAAAFVMSERLHARTPIRVVDGHAQAIPADDNIFDVAVVSLVLCSVADPAAALAEIGRVLRPGGRLHFYEHVVATTPGLRRAQHLSAPLWGAVAGGCNPGRDTVAAIRSAGYQITQLERFLFRPGPLIPLGLAAPHVIGVATKPD